MSEQVIVSNRKFVVTYTAPGGAVKRRMVNLHFHRAFVAWFDKAKHRFALPLRIIDIRKHYLRLAIDGFGGCLEVGISSWDVMVYVYWQGNYIDAIYPNDTRARCNELSYYHLDCMEYAISHDVRLDPNPPEPLRHYPNRESLWNERLFERLLESDAAECITNRHLLSGKNVTLNECTAKVNFRICL